VQDVNHRLIACIFYHLANHGSFLTYFVLSAATDAGSFNNSVAEQQVGCFFFFSQILNDSRFDSVGAFSFGCKMNLFNIIISD
jgi:hypothetical protein